jgi:heme/copper-type cytochrome/quinol oxidase subunit 2
MPEAEERPTARERAPVVLALAVFAALGLVCEMDSKGVVLAQPAREVTATKTGWRPSVLNAKKGEAVSLMLKTEGEERCFAIDELRIEKRIVPGRATPLEFTPDRAGNFAYYDCLDPDVRKGRLAVSE